ncbi:hypothetical protein ABZT49_03870 [Methylobacterium sp. EM32]|uniref:hypothetical protein n=1 Tax=Methylobacterium sp. EM32 TaxID=3163481 RepID=UPI00339EAE00
MTRRFFVARAAASASIAAPADVMAPTDAIPDAELISLGHDLNEAWKAERVAVDEAVEGAVLRCCDIVKRIERQPATTLAGLTIKVLALSWCHDGDPLAWASLCASTTDRRLVASILTDIMAAGGTA